MHRPKTPQPVCHPSVRPRLPMPWRRSSRALGCIALAVAWLTARQSRCEPGSALPSLQLNWPDIQGCPSRDDVYRAIEHHLGDNVERTKEVAATATIEQVQGYRLVLYTRSKTGLGTRELSGDSCRSVTDAAVVVLAMMLGADDITDASVGATTSPSRKVAVPPAADHPSSSSVALKGSVLLPLPPKSRRGVEARIGAGAWVPFGIARTPQLGLVASGEVEFLGWRLTAQVGWVPERRIGLAGADQRGAWVTLASAALGMGPVIGRGPWALVPRLGISEQILHGSGYGVDRSVSRSAYFASIRAGELLELRLFRQVFVQSTFDLLVPLQRPGLLLYPGGEVVRPASLGLEASLRLALRI